MTKNFAKSYFTILERCDIEKNEDVLLLTLGKTFLLKSLTLISGNRFVLSPCWSTRVNSKNKGKAFVLLCPSLLV